LRNLRILLAEDVAMVRGALVALLELEPDLKVVAAVERGDEIVPAAQAHQPDIAIIDIDLPGLDGISAAEQLHQKMPSCPTLILTNLGRAGTLRRALAAHVRGYMLKDAPPEQLADAVRTLARGDSLFAPSVVRRLVETYVSQPAPIADRQGSALAALTEREVHVLREIAAGRSNAEIAARLYLSEATVKTHVTRILAKLDLRDRVQAVVLAYELGVVRPGARSPRSVPPPGSL
jgi:two-component system response regulator DesR